MNESIEQIVKALRKVPERKLLIIELANSIPLKHGDLDVDVLREMQPQVNLAIAEAKAYGAHTLQAVDTLVRLPVHSELKVLTTEDLEEF